MEDYIFYSDFIRHIYFARMYYIFRVLCANLRIPYNTYERPKNTARYLATEYIQISDPVSPKKRKNVKQDVFCFRNSL